MEEHTNGINSATLTAMASEALWCQQNNKTCFMFIGGATGALSNGLGWAQNQYEQIFAALTGTGIQPNSPNLIWFRQSGFQGETQLPENVEDPTSTAVYSETAWLNKRLSGPMITNSPSPQAATGVPWSWQPTATAFGATNFTWSISNAPAGMNVNSSSGLVAWTPGSNVSSSGPVTLTVTNNAGLGGSDSYVFTVGVPIVFNLSTATVTSTNATMTLTNQYIGGVPCTVKLVMTGYSSTHNLAGLAKGAGAVAGGLVVTDGNTNNIDGKEGINFDIQVTGSVSNVSYSIIQFVLNGYTSTQRAYTITDAPGTTLGAAGNQIDGASNLNMGTGIAIPVNMGPTVLRDNFDFSWNRTSGLGPIASLNSVSIVISAPVPPTISTASTLPAGVVGAAYNQTLAATNGVAPYSWVVTSGSLPAGLNLNDDGNVSGTPTVAGNSSFGVIVTGNDGGISSAQFTLAVAPAPTITTAANLPSGAGGAFYSNTLAATGGATPYSWSLVSGSLQNGLGLSPAGVISGTPSASGASTFTVRVTGSDGGSSTKQLNLTINPAPTITSGSPLPSGAVNAPYSQSLTATGGTVPYVWSPASGSLPAGLSLSAAGVISGAPTTSGVSTFSVTVTGNDGGNSTAQLSLTIYPAPAITTGNPLPDAVINSVYTQSLAASGGASPYTWSLASGSLPGGLSLGSNGAITGTAIALGTSTFNVRVTGNDGGNSTSQFNLTVNPPPLNITAATPMASGTVGSAYSQTMTAAGGVPPYTWSTVPGMGNIPDGLILDPAGILSGTPSAAGTFSFRLKAVDTRSANDVKNVSLTISLAPASAALTSPTNNASYTLNCPVASGSTPTAAIPLAATVTDNGNPIDKVQFFANGTTLVGESGTAPYNCNWVTQTRGNYTITARAVYSGTSTPDSNAANITVLGLPAGWSIMDVGSGFLAGSASETNGVYTVQGAGNVGSTADSFRFISQASGTNCELKLRMPTYQTTTNSRSGIMIRESSAAGAKMAVMSVNPNGSYSWQRRMALNNATATVTGTTAAAPNVWLRLKRTGDTITGYSSTDGVSWTTVSSANFGMVSQVSFGVFVVTGSNGTLNTSTFDNVTALP